MAYYVYIIQSEVDHSFYKGYTEHPLEGLVQHNAGEMIYSSRKVPWKLVGLLIFDTKKEALITEKKLKKYDHQRLIAFINSERNKVQQCLDSFGLLLPCHPYTRVGTGSSIVSQRQHRDQKSPECNWRLFYILSHSDCRKDNGYVKIVFFKSFIFASYGAN